MYRIQLNVDGYPVSIEIGMDIDIAKFLFWLKASDCEINKVEKVSELHHPKNSPIGRSLIEEFKKEEKFKGE